MKKQHFIGIDLGTTNTTCIVGHLEEGKFYTEKLPIKQLIKHPKKDDVVGFPEKEGKIPSIVLLEGEDNAYVGEYCTRKFDKLNFEDKYTIIKSIKSVMGYDNWKKDVSERRYHTPITIASIILKTIWHSIIDNERIDSDNIASITITIPASFSSKMRKNTLMAASLAGFPIEKVSLLDEPVASMFSLWNQDTQSIDVIRPKDKILIYDLGGGTIDVSILEYADDAEVNVVKILSTSRYNEIGGDDLDLELAALILNKVRQTEDGSKYFGEATNTIEYNDAVKLLHIAERLKIKINEKLNEKYPDGILAFTFQEFLSGEKVNLEDNIEIKLSKYFPKLGVEKIDISILDGLKTFQKFINVDYYDNEPEFKNFITPLHQAIKRANVQIEDIRDVFVVGGGSRLLPVTNEIGKLFKRKVNKELDADFAISKGASIYSFLKHTKQWVDDQKLHDKILIQRDGNPFFEVIKNVPISIPFEDIEITVDEKKSGKITFDQICSNTNYSNKFCLRFFEGSGRADPYLRETTSEEIELPYEFILNNPWISKIKCSYSAQKVFSFNIKWIDEFGDECESNINIDKGDSKFGSGFISKFPFKLYLNKREWN